MAKARVCCVCGKEIRKRDEIALNKKMLGKDTARYYCVECLAEQLEVTVDFLYDQIEVWKEQGCALFG